MPPCHVFLSAIILRAFDLTSRFPPDRNPPPELAAINHEQDAGERTVLVVQRTGQRMASLEAALIVGKVGGNHRDHELVAELLVDGSAKDYVRILRDEIVYALGHRVDVLQRH